MVKERLFLIFNPNSGKGKRAGTLRRIQDCLSGQFHVELNITTSRDQARRTAEKITSVHKKPLIVVAGGDGTINDIINGCRMDNIVLGLIPAGTANIIALQLGIPLTIKDSCAIIKNRVTRKIDIGLANRTRFIFCAGLGFDGNVVKSVKLEHKLLLGQSVYLLQAVKTLMKLRPFHSMVIIDGQKVFDGPVFQVIIGKSNYYAGKFALFKDASLSNGYFDVALFTHPNKLRFTLGCVSFFMRRNDTQRLLFRGKNIIVQTIEPVPTQLDGDLADDTPVEFQLIGQTLEVLVPAGV